MEKQVFLNKVLEYKDDLILNSLSEKLFDIITPGIIVVLKPNWVRQSHLRHEKDWEHVITHPTVITAVLKKVTEHLGNGGKIIITDGPQTDSDFKKILDHYPVNQWKEICKAKNVTLQIIDLREDEWLQKDGVTVERKKLPGDPSGSTEVNLSGDQSEFFNHKKSKRGYYGADYNMVETNKAHDGYNNLYRVSRSVIEADVFINLPKLKTHKKAGITCCLKNLVGINTYKNFLPHHSEGSPSEGGDQFPDGSANAAIEGPVVAFIRKKLLTKPVIAKLLVPFRKTALSVFGDSSGVIRSGNWYGNDTAWRMILDLNKILFYANPDGSLREDNLIKAKHYIGIVDAIIAGEGNGPLEPDPLSMNCIISGTNPVAIDAVAAHLMGFDPLKIPAIRNAFSIKKFRLCDFEYKDINIQYNWREYNMSSLPGDLIVPCRAHFGWKGHIETN